MALLDHTAPTNTNRIAGKLSLNSCFITFSNWYFSELLFSTNRSHAVALSPLSAGRHYTKRAGQTIESITIPRRRWEPPQRLRSENNTLISLWFSNEADTLR